MRGQRSLASNFEPQFTSSLQPPTCRRAPRWQVDDEGEVSDLLGVEINHHADAGVVELTQTAYIEKLAAKWFPNGVPSTTQSSKTPADALLPQFVADALLLEDDRDPAAIRAYHSRASLVPCCTRRRTRARTSPMPSVCSVAPWSSRPRSYSQPRCVCWVIFPDEAPRANLGLRYRTDSQPAQGYSDSDWAVKHSTSGYVFIYNSAAIVEG